MYLQLSVKKEPKIMNDFIVLEFTKDNCTITDQIQLDSQKDTFEQLLDIGILTENQRGSVHILENKKGKLIIDKKANRLIFELRTA